LLINQDVKTFPCPSCERVRLAWQLSCESCGHELSATQAAVAIDEHDRFLASYSSAHTLLTAGQVSLLFALVEGWFSSHTRLFFFPYTATIVVTQLVLLLRWHIRFGWPASWPREDASTVRLWVAGGWLLWLGAVLYPFLVRLVLALDLGRMLGIGRSLG
jgi:hypothetical protein